MVCDDLYTVIIKRDFVEITMDWSRLTDKNTSKKYIIGNRLVLPELPSDIINTKHVMAVGFSKDFGTSEWRNIERSLAENGVDTIVYDNIQIDSIENCDSLFAGLRTNLSVSLSNRSIQENVLADLFSNVKCRNLYFTNNIVTTKNLVNMFGAVNVAKLDLRKTRFMGNKIIAREMFRKSIIHDFIVDDDTFIGLNAGSKIYAEEMFAFATIGGTLNLGMIGKKYLRRYIDTPSMLFRCYIKKLDLRDSNLYDYSNIFFNTFIAELVLPNNEIRIRCSTRINSNLGYVHSIRIDDRYNKDSNRISNEVPVDILIINKEVSKNVRSNGVTIEVSEVRYIDTRIFCKDNYTLSDVNNTVIGDVCKCDYESNDCISNTQCIVFAVDKKIQIDESAKQYMRKHKIMMMNEDYADSLDDYVAKALSRKKALGISDILKIIVMI